VDALGTLSEPETVLIAVRAVNDAPVAAAQTLRTLEDVPRSIRFQSADVDLLSVRDPLEWPGLTPPNYGPAPHDADPLYSVVSPPQHGTLSGSGPVRIYIPAPDFRGTDSFTFSASDGLDVSDPVTVTITIDPDNDADLLPDAWELAAFSALTHSGSDDPDGDGQDNTFEYITGNNPGDANSCLSLEPAPGGLFRLNSVRPGVRYHLESSTSLEAWERINKITPDIAGPAAIADPRTGPSGRCFYRVTVEQEKPVPLTLRRRTGMSPA